MRDAVDQILAVRSQSRSRRGFGAGLGAAVLLHGAAVLAYAFAPGKASPPPLEYVAVRVVPLAALGRPEAPPQPARKPPPQQPEPEPPAADAPPEPPAAAPEAPVLALPEAESRPSPEPPPSPAAEPQPRGPQAGSAEGSPRGTSPFGATRLEGIDPDFTYDYYLDRMLSLIHGQWKRPYTEGEVRAVLRFTVRESGEIVDLDLDEPSGFSTFDLAALRAVQNASPLPRLPASYRKGELRVTLIVR